MYLEIVSPEKILFSSEIDSVAVPGIDGEFQMLNNHAPIVSVLKEGTVKVRMNAQNPIKKEDLNSNFSVDSSDNKVLNLEINSGTLELKNNKLIILAD